MTAVVDAPVLAGLDGELDALFESELSVRSGSELVAMLAGTAAARARLDAFEVRVIAEAQRQHIAFDHGATSLPDLVAGVTRCSRGEARARVRRSVDLAPRTALTGEALEPIHPHAAAAFEAGQISAAHADAIVDCLGRIPPTCPLEDTAVAERCLVDIACHEAPLAVRRAGQVLLARLDPDGVEPRDERIQRERCFGLRDNPDGTKSPYGTLTPEWCAIWQPVLDALAAPLSAGEDGQRDERSYGQRLHDAFLEAGERLLRSGTLPASGGLPVTILIHTKPGDLTRPGGLVRTGHDDLLSTAALQRLAGEGEIVEVRTGHLGGICDYGRTRRLATPGQRKALAVRDGGCCFPSCTRPAAWTEAHHVIPWEQDGETNLDNLCLLCAHHHRSFEAAGWTLTMPGGVPTWTPPASVDPQRKPRRNCAHHIDIDFTA